MIVSWDDAIERLQSAVEAAGSQAEFARRVGVSRNNISSMLSHKIPPTGKVCAYLGLKKVIGFEITTIHKDPKQEQYENERRMWREGRQYKEATQELKK